MYRETQPPNPCRTGRHSRGDKGAHTGQRTAGSDTHSPAARPRLSDPRGTRSRRHGRGVSCAATGSESPGGPEDDSGRRARGTGRHRPLSHGSRSSGRVSAPQYRADPRDRRTEWLAYFSLEYVDGKPLSHECRGLAVAPERAAELLETIAPGDALCPPARGRTPGLEAGQHPVDQ